MSTRNVVFSAAFIIGFGVWADGQSEVKNIRFRIKSERNCCLFRVTISFVVWEVMRSCTFEYMRYHVTWNRNT